jgi:hypothetical protein
MAPPSTSATYTLVTHRASNADLARWQASSLYRAIETPSEIFVPYAEMGERAHLRNDKLQRDWILAKP